MRSANHVAIVDYGLCNLDSVRRAVEECGGTPYVTDQPSELDAADRIILPGVGSFPHAMANLRELGLDAALRDQVYAKNAPFLGICLGMQLLAGSGAEGAEDDATAGLGWFDGTVERLEPTAEDPRVPHMGWNEVWPTSDAVLFDGIVPGTDFYFVHSFHVVAELDKHIAATTPYCGGFTSSIQDSAVFGVQFHPEKSQTAGFALLRNFLAI